MAVLISTVRNINFSESVYIGKRQAIPHPDLKTAAAAWIYAGGAHHTSFSYSLTADHLRDFAEMAGVEFLLIDEHTRVEDFKEKLRWNDLYYSFAQRLSTFRARAVCLLLTPKELV